MSESEPKSKPKGKIGPHNPVENPCYKENTLSLNCLMENADSEKCQLYFDNYNICQAFWKKVRFERRIKGITPELPGPEEREKIKQEYFASLPKKPE